MTADSTIPSILNHMQEAGNLSILFDVGGVAGGALAGSLSDKFGAAASVSAAFVFASLPAMFLYRAFGHISLGWNVFLMATAGCFVNGPYALITTAVSADLGNHSSVAGAPPRVDPYSRCPWQTKAALGQKLVCKLDCAGVCFLALKTRPKHLWIANMRRHKARLEGCPLHGRRQQRAFDLLCRQ